METLVVKRNGSTEPFDASKINKMAVWAVGDLDVTWSDIALEAFKMLQGRNPLSVTDIQESLIKVCLDREDFTHNVIAGRLFLGELRKVHKCKPDFKSHYKEMVQKGFYRPMNYTDADLEIMSKVIADDPEKDMMYGYPTLRQFRDKYAVKDAKGNLLEMPQYMYMAIAMSMLEGSLLTDVIGYYQKISAQKINLPSPVLSQQRTLNNTGVSCVITTAGDTLQGIEAAKHIAFMATASSAGLGVEYDVRSVKDPVRNGYAQAGGKLPHYRVLDGIVKEVKQSSRGGSATVSYRVIDPEIFTLLVLKLKRSPETKRIDQLDYSVLWNNDFLRRAAKKQPWALVSKVDCPELWDNFSNDRFTEIMDRVLADDSIKKKVVNAFDILSEFVDNRLEAGRIYRANLEEVNKHTPFNEEIRLSNLCVAPETLLLTDVGEVAIGKLEGKTVNAWNGEEFSEVVVAKTGSNQPMIEVELDNYITNSDRTVVQNIVKVKVTPYHKWYNWAGYEFRTFQLEEGMDLEEWVGVSGEIVESRVVSLNPCENSDTYCAHEPKRNRLVFNGVMTGNCQEVLLPTKPYNHITELYKTSYEDGDGLTAQCFLSAIDIANIEDDKDYEEVAYFILKSLDNLINNMSYPFPQFEVTAKAYRSVGVGITNLAFHLARNGKRYSDYETIHEIAERHYYFLLKASVRLAEERGKFEWIGKTKWQDGWIPLDTYNRNADLCIGEPTLKYDWEALRQEVLTKGVRFSTLTAHMPCESSSIFGGSTNGLYPIRDKMIYKTSEKGAIQFFAPHVDTLAYELAWDLDPYVLLNDYGIFQKWCDQTISADTYIRKIEGVQVSKAELVRQHLYSNRIGVKTLYYNNTRSGRGEGSTIIEDSGCESCTL